MIISHQHKFIFIKTQKTAGTSTEIALSRICGPDDIITPLSPEEEKIRKDLGYRGAQNYIIPFSQYKKLDWMKLAYFRKRMSFFHHMSAHQIMWYLNSDTWDSYYKFCFERNPWDKVVSYYYFHEGYKSYKSIKEFLLSGEGGDMRGFDLYNQGGIPLVDKVFKFEEIEAGLNELSKRFNLQEPLKLPSYRAKGDIRKDKRHYREILTQEEADIIAKIFAREIKYFAYVY